MTLYEKVYNLLKDCGDKQFNFESHVVVDLINKRIQTIFREVGAGMIGNYNSVLSLIGSKKLNMTSESACDQITWMIIRPNK